MSSNADSQLAPPGAGLPGPELFIARLLFRLQKWRGNRDSFNARFIREREAIRRSLARCDGTAAGTRVLIKRLPGMEDSSRHWSVWMTLDHLRIVNHGIAKTIASLAREISPSGRASTAADSSARGAPRSASQRRAASLASATGCSASSRTWNVSASTGVLARAQFIHADIASAISSRHCEIAGFTVKTTRTRFR